MNQSFKQRVIIWYTIIFYLLMIYKLFNGMLMYQAQPAFFNTRFDLFTWVFMRTGIHQWLLNNPPGWMLADLLFYSFPALYLLSFLSARKYSWIAALLMLAVNWTYVQCYTLYPTNSIGGHIAWLLFPVVFLAGQPKTFSLLFEGLRYFFLFFFSSSAIWKFSQGGLLNLEQMSAILLEHHKEQLTNSPDHWIYQMHYWLIAHPQISYLLYLGAFLMQLSFGIGFFTKKFDRYLVIIFIVFLIADYLVMRIPYFEVGALLLTLLLHDKEEDKSRSPILRHSEATMAPNV